MKASDVEFCYCAAKFTGMNYLEYQMQKTLLSIPDWKNNVKFSNEQNF